VRCAVRAFHGLIPGKSRLAVDYTGVGRDSERHCATLTRYVDSAEAEQPRPTPRSGLGTLMRSDIWQ
jgi:hypothetical protein